MTYYNKYLKYKSKYLKLKNELQCFIKYDYNNNDYEILNKLTNKLLFNKYIDNIQLNKDNVFGVFVSIERSKMQKLGKYPEEIHGCIGYWDNEFNKLDNNTINNKIIDVGKKAYYNDSRRTYFTKNPKTDIFTKIKIYFMKLPKYNVDNNGNINGNEIFNNNNNGLIVQNKLSGSRATYLPNSNWTYIKNSLINIASTNNTNNNEFIAYTIYIIEWYLLDFLIRYFM